MAEGRGERGRSSVRAKPASMSRRRSLRLTVPSLETLPAPPRSKGQSEGAFLTLVVIPKAPSPSA